MDIPEDIMQVADNVCFDVSISITEAAAVEIIARAILAERERATAAERERCAKIAEATMEGSIIAFAIRTPPTGEEQ